MKLIHFSGLEKIIDCQNFDNIVLSWNLNDDNYFKKYKNKKIFFVSKFWHKKKFIVKNKVINVRKIILSDLINKLNLINKIHYSQKAWEILLEPWLTLYLETNYFRWLIIEALIKKGNFKYLEIKVSKKIPEFDTIEFTELNFNDDVYNHLSFQDMLKFKKKFKKNKIVINKKFKLRNKFFFRNLKYNYLFTLYEKLVEKISSNKIFIHIKTKKINLLTLCLKLNILPFKGLLIFDRRKLLEIFNKQSFDKKKRSQITLSFKKKDEFDKYISIKIQRDLPRVFLENFNDIQNLHQNKLPKTKIIVSDTLHKYNAAFKSWLAFKKNLNKNFKIITADHGGLYGNGKRTYDYDQAISSVNLKYKKKVSKNQISLPSLFLDKNKTNLKRQILIICHDTSKYPRYFFTGPICEEIYFQYHQVKKFTNNLCEDINKRVFIRPYTINSGWKLGEKYKRLFGEQKIINSNIKYNKLRDQAAIKIITYPKTAFLESLINGPTFLLFNKEHYCDIKQNEKFMNILFKNKIAFTNGRDLAIHINEIEKDIESWWQQNKIQKSIDLFIKNNNIYTKNPTTKWAKVIKKLLSITKNKKNYFNNAKNS